jgi:hypothetical protein
MPRCKNSLKTSHVWKLQMQAESSKEPLFSKLPKLYFKFSKILLKKSWM